MASTYVIGATEPFGESYMSYHIGRILSREFEYELNTVSISDSPKSLFEYDTPMGTVALDSLGAAIQRGIC